MKIFDRLLKRLHSKKLYLVFFSSMLVTFFISMVAYTFLYSGYVLPRYEEKLVEAHKNYFSKLSVSFETDLQQFHDIAVQIAGDSLFSSYYLTQHQYSCFDVVRKLLIYRGCSPKLVDILYVRQDNPYIYTSLGVYNTKYYNQNSVAIQSQGSNNLWKNRFLSNIEALAPNISGPTLEYVVPVMNQTAAVIFQIDVTRMLLGESPAILASGDGLLLLADGEKIFSSNLSSDLEQQILKDYSEGKLVSGVYHKDFYLYTLSSDLPGVSFVFLTPYHRMVNEYAAMNWNFMLFSLGFMVFCLFISIFLARWHYKPIQKLKLFFGQIVGEIPANYSETQGFDYAMRWVVRYHDSLLQEKMMATQERILRQLAEGGEWDFTAMDLQCKEAGIHVDNCACCALLMGVREDKPIPTILRSDFANFLRFARIRFYRVNNMERNNDFYLCVLPPEGEKLLYQIIRNGAENLCKSYSEAFYISVGSPCLGYQDISRSFWEAHLTAQLQARFPNEIVLEYLNLQPVSSSHYPYPSVEIDGLYTAIIGRNCQQITRLTHLLIDRASQIFGQHYLSRCLCYDIANTMLRAVNELEQISDVPISVPLLPDLMEFQRFSDFESLIYGMETAILSQLESKTSQNHELCMEIVQYIKEHIHTPDLCIKTLCSEFHISQSTLSALFREKMGMTVAGYIGVLRNEYVKSLLVSTDLSISEITKQLGYSQPSSFIRQFKNAEGITPGEYRQKHQKQEHEK